MNRIVGEGWYPDEVVTITINGSSDTVTASDKGGFDYIGAVFGSGTLSIEVADSVILKSDSSEIQHEVRALIIETVAGNPKITSVSGTAVDGAEVAVIAHPGGEFIGSAVTAGGAWNIDFTGHLYINDPEETLILAIITDENGNSTVAFWDFPGLGLLGQQFYDEGFQVAPQLNMIMGDGWGENSEINIKIFGEGIVEPHDITISAENDGSFAIDGEHVSWPVEFNLAAGQIVRISQINDSENPAANPVKILEVQTVGIVFELGEGDEAEDYLIKIDSIPSVNRIDLTAVRFVDDAPAGSISIEDIEADGNGEFTLNTSGYDGFPPDSVDEVIILIAINDDDWDSNLIIGGNFDLIPNLIGLLNQ